MSTLVAGIVIGYFSAVATLIFAIFIGTAIHEGMAR